MSIKPSPSRVARADRARGHVYARPSAARRPVARPAARSAGVSVSRVPERRRRADRPDGRARVRRPRRADRQRTPAHLQGAGRLDQPAGARAGRGLRRQAGQPGADPLRQQPGDGGRVAGGDQGRRRGGQHHAAAARRRADHDRRQGARSAFALCDNRIADELVAVRQRQPLSPAASSASTAPPITTPSSIASPSTSRCRFDAVRTGRDDVALLGFTSGTTGEPKATDAFPPRPADHRRRLREGSAAA